MEAKILDLSPDELTSVSGGETAATHREISEAIIAAGIVTADPILFALGVAYALTD